MSMRALLLASAFLVGMCVITTGRPVEQIHAFCKVAWLFGVPCAQVNMVIVDQIKSMGQYKLETASPVLIKANHTSMIGQVERLNFTMVPTALGLGCNVGGSSVSAFWYSPFDNGTNYCNIYNVILGSGLTKAPGYTEYTNEWICLGYGLATCKI